MPQLDQPYTAAVHMPHTAGFAKKRRRAFNEFSYGREVACGGHAFTYCVRTVGKQEGGALSGLRVIQGNPRLVGKVV
jgi:hypothetical protein